MLAPYPCLFATLEKASQFRLTTLYVKHLEECQLIFSLGILQESEHPVPRPDKIRYGFWIGELKEFPKMGSVIPVMVVTGKIDSEDLEIRKGQWVKLRNIVVHSVCGQWQVGVFHDSLNQSN